MVYLVSGEQNWSTVSTAGMLSLILTSVSEVSIRVCVCDLRIDDAFMQEI